MSQLLQELLCKLTEGQLLCRLQLLQATKAIKAIKATKATATEAVVSDCCTLRAATCWSVPPRRRHGRLFLMIVDPRPFGETETDMW